MGEDSFLVVKDFGTTLLKTRIRGSSLEVLVHPQMCLQGGLGCWGADTSLNWAL